MGVIQRALSQHVSANAVHTSPAACVVRPCTGISLQNSCSAFVTCTPAAVKHGAVHHARQHKVVLTIPAGTNSRPFKDFYTFGECMMHVVTSSHREQP